MSFEQLPAELRLAILSNLCVKEVVRSRILNTPFQALVDEVDNETVLFEVPLSRERARLEQDVYSTVDYPTNKMNFLYDFDKFIAHRGLQQVKLEITSFIRTWMPKVFADLPILGYRGLERCLKPLCELWLRLHRKKHVKGLTKEYVRSSFIPNTMIAQVNIRLHLLAGGETARWKKENFERLWVNPESNLRGSFFDAGPRDPWTGPRRPRWPLTELRENGHQPGNVECKDGESNPAGGCCCGYRYAWSRGNLEFQRLFLVPYIQEQDFAYCASSERTYKMVKAASKGWALSIREKAEVLADTYLY